jgi:hypothetical protein
VIGICGRGRGLAPGALDRRAEAEHGLERVGLALLVLVRGQIVAQIDPEAESVSERDLGAEAEMPRPVEIGAHRAADAAESADTASEEGCDVSRRRLEDQLAAHRVEHALIVGALDLDAGAHPFGLDAEE